MKFLTLAALFAAAAVHLSLAAPIAQASVPSLLDPTVPLRTIPDPTTVDPKSMFPPGTDLNPQDNAAFSPPGTGIPANPLNLLDGKQADNDADGNVLDQLANNANVDVLKK